MNDINPTTGLPMSGGGIDAVEHLMEVAQIVLMMKRMNLVAVILTILLIIGAGKLMYC